jgi:hypothetical protein
VSTCLCKDDDRIYINSDDARHFAAVLALHRTSWNKKLHMTIPPAYREYWYVCHEFGEQLANKEIWRISTPTSNVCE